MIVGKLDNKIHIEKPVNTQDAAGGIVEAWQDEFTAWASIRPVSAKMQLQGEQITNEITHKLTLRALDVVGIDTSMRVRYDDGRRGEDRYFDIDSIINVAEADDMLHLVCIEQAGVQL